jgi:hypothetical protein
VELPARRQAQAPRQAGAADDVLGWFRAINAERTGIAQALIVLVVCMLVSLACWYQLDLPARAVRAILPEPTCTSIAPGTTLMFFCSTGIGLLTLLGPLVALALLVVFRKPLVRGLGILLPKLPEELRFLVVPVLATIVFTITWAGLHYEAPGDTGFLPNIVFPAFVGIFTFLGIRYAAPVQRALAPFFDLRDRIPKTARLAAVVGVPVLVSWLLTRAGAEEDFRTMESTIKEQLIVVIALANAWLLISPRAGELPPLSALLGRVEARP